MVEVLRFHDLRLRLFEDRLLDEVVAPQLRDEVAAPHGDQLRDEVAAPLRDEVVTPHAD